MAFAKATKRSVVSWVNNVGTSAAGIHDSPMACRLILPCWNLLVLWIFALLILSSSSPVEAFVTPSPISISVRQRIGLSFLPQIEAKDSKIARLYMAAGSSDHDEQSETDKDSESNLSLAVKQEQQEDSSSSTDRKKIKIVVPKVVQKVWDGAFYLWSYIIITLGIALSCGLVLNIFGYGYQLTDDGIRIDTIEQFRIENQFQIEIQNSMKQQQNGLRFEKTDPVGATETSQR